MYRKKHNLKIYKTEELIQAIPLLFIPNIIEFIIVIVN
jgi:hypothetical protein